MRSTLAIAAVLLSGLATQANARIIHEDFSDGTAAAFDPELSYYFGQDNDYTPNDLYTLSSSGLHLYPDLASVVVDSLAAHESIQSVQVQLSVPTVTDYTLLIAYNLAGDEFYAVNTLTGTPEILTLTADDLGEPIQYFAIAASDTLITDIWINVVPAPSSLAFLPMGSLVTLRRRR